MRLPLLSLALLIAPFLAPHAARQTAESAAEHKALLAAKAETAALVQEWAELHKRYQAAEAKVAQLEQLELKRDASGKVQPWGPALSPYDQRYTQAERVANQYADPYKFTDWLNGERMARGIPAVEHSPALAEWAAQNNPPMLAARRSDHYVNPGYWQVSFYGPRNLQEAAAGFMASPSHASFLMDPTVKAIGVAVTADEAGNLAWTVDISH